MNYNTILSNAKVVYNNCTFNQEVKAVVDSVLKDLNISVFDIDSLGTDSQEDTYSGINFTDDSGVRSPVLNFEEGN